MRGFAALLTLLLTPLAALTQDISVGEVFEMLDSPVEEYRADAQIVLETIAEEEHPIIYRDLAEHFETKQPPDILTAERYLMRWTEHEIEDAYIELALFYRRQGQLTAFVDTLEETRTKFDSNMAVSWLAYAHYYGVGVPTDKATALDLLHELYEKGAILVPTCNRCEPIDIRMMMVGALLESGSTSYDPAEALIYAEQVAENGDLSVLTLWAGHVLTSDLPQLYDRAVQTLINVRNHSDNPTDFSHASFYLSVHFFTSDPVQSYQFASSALERQDIQPGDKSGLVFIVGMHLLSGYGAPADPVRAVDMLVEASELGVADATAIVAVLSPNQAKQNAENGYGCEYACEFVAELHRVQKRYERLEVEEKSVRSDVGPGPGKRVTTNPSRGESFFGQLFGFVTDVLSAVATVTVEVAKSDPYAFGYMLSGAPGNYQRPSKGLSRSSRPTVSTQSESCISDFNCPSGYACAKKPYYSSGICLRSVNEWGGPSLIKRGDSIRPGQPACNTFADCPIGFTCDITLRQCVKL